jgi:hypothetical protein
MSSVEDILNAVLNALGDVSPVERGHVFSTVIAEILMDGSTIQSSLPQSPEIIERIAASMGAKPTPTRNKYIIYPFARPSISASGPSFYICAKTGELMLLLTRVLKSSDEWFYAAGWIEVLPPNVEMVYSDRVSEAARNKAEEATIGMHIAIPEGEDFVPALSTQTFPRQRPLTQLIHNEFKRLWSTERWDMALAKLTDINYLRDLFKRYGVNWPEKIDISAKDTFIRETWEETGLNLHDYPQAIIEFVNTLDVSIVGGISRLYNVDQLYYAYLGILDKTPPLTEMRTESVEAAWMPVSDISYDAKRNQYVAAKDGRSLLFTAVRGIEYTLHNLLEHCIEKISRIQKSTGESVPLFSNLAGVQAALAPYASKHPAIAALVEITLGPDHTLPTLVHDKGQAYFCAFLAAAKGLAMKEDAKTLEERIARACAQPAMLAELVK